MHTLSTDSKFIYKNIEEKQSSGTCIDRGLVDVLSDVIGCVSDEDPQVAEASRRGLDDFIDGLVTMSAFVCVEGILDIFQVSESLNKQLVCLGLIRKLLTRLEQRKEDVIPDVISILYKNSTSNSEVHKEKLNLLTFLQDSSSEFSSDICKSSIEYGLDSSKTRTEFFATLLECKPGSVSKRLLSFVTPVIKHGVIAKELDALLVCCHIVRIADERDLVHYAQELITPVEEFELQEMEFIRTKEILRSIIDQCESTMLHLPMGLSSTVASHCKSLIRRGGSQEDLQSIL